MAILMPGAGAKPRYRYARLEITEQKRTDGNAASYAGVSQFTLWCRAVGILPAAVMTGASAPAPFSASASTQAANREAWRAFSGVTAAVGFGWLATDATGWVELDMGTPRDITAFSLGASHDGTGYTYPTKWRLTLHNGVVAAGRIVYDNTSGAVTWANAHTDRATVLSEAAAGRLPVWTAIQNGAYFSAVHQAAARNGFVRIDVYPQTGDALRVGLFRVYDGSSWIPGNATTVNLPLGVMAGETAHATTYRGYVAWAAAQVSDWYIGACGGVAQSFFGVLPTDPVDIRGLEITGAPAGYETSSPGSFTLYTWDGNGWTQRGSATGITWASARQVQQFTW